MTYYERSLLMISWTNQHGCGNPLLYCNVVIQYMCEDPEAPPERKIRDGSCDTTDTIPNNEQGPLEVNGEGELLYGMHEPRSNYVACTTRNRNMGLFIADRQQEGGLGPNRAAARFTRQDNNGNRYGYECNEERDYYPYWHPTQWRDIVVFANNEDHCEFYRKESQNVKDKFECVNNNGSPTEHNSKGLCEASNNEWKRTNKWDISAPACMKAPWNRQNHLGNSNGGQPNHYNWTIPEQGDIGDAWNSRLDGTECVLRIRYNMSTNDIKNGPDSDFSDFRQNGELSPVKDDAIKEQDGYGHELALNTAQFGRTFEDRSHVFWIKKRPSSIPRLAKVYNLNVQGKRGNIVQAYPAVEYDFVPKNLHVYRNDYIHFQWTGCDNNPQGNAGEGRAGGDRSNIVQMESDDKSHPADDKWLNSRKKLFPNRDVRVRMAMLDQPVDDPTRCLSRSDLLNKNNGNNNNAEQDVQNCMKLNNAGPYFDGGVQKMSTTGRYYFMSSRNNNFTNRAHKGSIFVEPLLPTWAIVIIVIGSVFFLLAGAAGVGIWYSKTHPHSQVARVFSKM
jgi:hypothetical protein